MVYWSSQKSTNGFGDVVSCPLTSLKSVKVVRLTYPQRRFSFNLEKSRKRDLPGEKIKPPVH
jgi:hypothetical protein